ncbi:hypothetical protein GCM10027521_07020 [Amycolatopsis cihanbeyliensis]
MAHARTAVARHGPTGTPLKPDLPEVGAAVAEGAIGPEHEETIRATVARFPQPVSLPDREHAEALLTTAAREYEPHTVTALGREIVARLNQDGNPPTEHHLTRPTRFLDWRDTRGGPGPETTTQTQPPPPPRKGGRVRPDQRCDKSATNSGPTSLSPRSWF